METTMNKLIFASILTVTISISASYADTNTTVNADKSARNTETVALKPETVDNKRANPDPTPVVAAPYYPKGLKDLNYVSDFPINAY
jgi:hypothetical protein